MKKTLSTCALFCFIICNNAFCSIISPPKYGKRSLPKQAIFKSTHESTYELVHETNKSTYESKQLFHELANKLTHKLMPDESWEKKYKEAKENSQIPLAISQQEIIQYYAKAILYSCRISSDNKFGNIFKLLLKGYLNEKPIMKDEQLNFENLKWHCSQALPDFQINAESNYKQKNEFFLNYASIVIKEDLQKKYQETYKAEKYYPQGRGKKEQINYKIVPGNIMEILKVSGEEEELKKILFD